jgi:hypothetical protein
LIWKKNIPNLEIREHHLEIYLGDGKRSSPIPKNIRCATMRHEKSNKKFLATFLEKNY